ncbi:MAG: preprotein translocase subunit SecG [Bacteroidetes bacterium]|nr:preprotein translocase subunit SecG [Bacteroidota bacterium]
MQALLTISIIVVCVLLILVVLVQNSKGGGISSNFSAANQIMGARRGTDFIEKATWTLAILLLVFSLLSTPKKAGVTDSSDDTEGSITKQKAGGAVMPVAQPAAQPAQQQPAAPNK